MKEIIQHKRINYSKGILLESEILSCPLEQFKLWLTEAIQADENYAHAMTLSTVDEDGFPTSRVVLLKDVNTKGFSFYSNLKSQKSRNIIQNNKVALNFFWKELERQVRIAGEVSKLPEEEADAYFASRPFESKIAASISNQSEVIPGRELLDQLFEENCRIYKDRAIVRPEFWGGYLVVPEKIEFWQGRENRLNDRILYTKEAEDWNIVRLAP